MLYYVFAHSYIVCSAQSARGCALSAQGMGIEARACTVLSVRPPRAMEKASAVALSLDEILRLIFEHVYPAREITAKPTQRVDKSTIVTAQPDLGRHSMRRLTFERDLHICAEDEETGGDGHATIAQFLDKMFPQAERVT